MDTVSSLHQFLVLYTWFPLTVLLAVMLLIARFYQKFSGEETYYWLYLLAIILFGALFVRIASVEFGFVDLLTNLLSAIVGILMLFLSLLLYFRMMNTKE